MLAAKQTAHRFASAVAESDWVARSGCLHCKQRRSAKRRRMRHPTTTKDKIDPTIDVKNGPGLSQRSTSMALAQVTGPNIPSDKPSATRDA